MPLPPGATKITARDARQLLKEVGFTRDEKLSKTLIAAVFRLADGRTLVMYEHGRGTLWQSHQDFEACLLAMREEARRVENLWEELLPQGQEFPAHVTELVSQLADRIRVRGDVLDLSEASLGHVDKAIRKLGRARTLTPEIFPGLVAYVGEVIRRGIGGRWEVIGSRQGWEPIVVDSRGERCAVLAVYKKIQENGRTVSLSAFARVQIIRRQQ
jgi:hypothetical protein